MPDDPIFEPLRFRNLEVKNRILRSNVSGRFDNYDGSGNQARINWELKFARGGVGAIISSFVPVTIQGRIVPNYATIDRDECIPFWRELGRKVHEQDCKFILQLSHSGRQRDIPGVEFRSGLSSTDQDEDLHGFPCRAMTKTEVTETVTAFAEGARRAREAGLDGVELHGANGYLITQFLSSAINDRDDEYGGPLENRARFVREVVGAIREKVGPDFHLQMKISAVEHHNVLEFFPNRKRAGNTLEDSIQVCNGKMNVCGEVRVVGSFSIEGCGTAPGLLHDEPNREVSHYRIKAKAFEYYDGDLQVQLQFAAGFAEFQIGKDKPGFFFGDPAGNGKVETAGPEGSLSMQWMLPVHSGLDFVADLTAGMAWFQRLPEIDPNLDRLHPFVDVTLGIGW